MKICEKCGAQAEDELKVCQVCGNIFENGTANEKEENLPKALNKKKKSKLATILLSGLLLLVAAFVIIGVLKIKDSSAVMGNVANMQPKTVSQEPTQISDNDTDKSSVPEAVPKETQPKEQSTESKPAAKDSVKKPVITAIDLSQKTTSWESEVGGKTQISYAITPIKVPESDLKVVSANADVAKTALASFKEVSGKIILTVSLTAEKVGETTVYVKSTDGSVSSAGFKVSVINKKDSVKKPGDTVYITPTGKKYHYSEKCAGKNAIATTLDEAKKKGLQPCGKCVN
ncbi:MAG: hypothetical protein Q8865_10175 [Bacillota bacterium]|nr:hypothetical protein [Bacillota bacterium]